jgi:superfamily II DNA or RNA helicase
MAPTSDYWTLLARTPSEARRFEIIGLFAGNIPDPARGSWGYAASYDAVISNALVHQSFMESRRVLLIADEAQFCATGMPFGRALQDLSERAAFVVLMSGDYDREDRRRVACVSYVPRIEDPPDEVTDVEEVELDVRYSLHDALQERSILPVDFSYGSGSVAFRKGDKHVETSLAAAGPDARPALWAALNSEYARELLTECVTSWRAHRVDGRLPHRTVRANPNAQLMVVTATQTQAEDTRDFLLSDLGFSPEEVALVISDNPESTALLERFCSGRIPVAITVAMAYVGTDAPKMSHLCVLTHYRSKAWLHQLFARVWRCCPGVDYGDDYCVAYCPDDPDLVEVVERIREMQQIGVRVSEEQQEPVRTGTAPSPAASVVVEASELTTLRHRFEFVGDADEVVRQARSRPSPEQTATLLRGLGYVEPEISRMLAVSDVVTRDIRPLPERLARLAEELERYQRRTAYLVADARGEGPDFRALPRKSGKRESAWRGA